MRCQLFYNKGSSLKSEFLGIKISLCRGDELGAALSFGAMIPFAGWASTGSKAALKYGDEVVAIGKNIIKGTDKSIDVNKVINSAIQTKKGGETVLGHALQKHAGRNPDIWGKIKGGPSQINETALNHLNDILNGVGEFKVFTTDKGVQFLEKILPDGRGVRLNMDGTFKGFIDQ